MGFGDFKGKFADFLNEMLAKSAFLHENYSFGGTFGEYTIKMQNLRKIQELHKIAKFAKSTKIAKFAKMAKKRGFVKRGQSEKEREKGIVDYLKKHANNFGKC